MTGLDVVHGDSPVLLSFPHTGTDLPAETAASLNGIGRKRTDTDWHVHHLYEDLRPDMTSIRTRIHRYVIDVNRDPTGASLYPDRNTTSLCPLTDFDGNSIYRDARAPGADEVERRRIACHAPYHAALSVEINRIKGLHGFAILLDCHSIRSRIPFLFDGILPDLNIGTDNGSTCASGIESAVLEICEGASGYTAVLNGRFRGGWTVRHHGDPQNSVHAIQMELAQSTYLETEEPPWDVSIPKRDRLRVHLSTLLKTLNAWRPDA